MRLVRIAQRLGAHQASDVIGAANGAGRHRAFSK
jgi:hypothetical protein